MGFFCLFYHHWSKWWTLLEIEHSFTNRFHNAFGFDLKFLNCSTTKFKWKGAGLWVLRARDREQGVLTALSCHCSEKNEVQHATLERKEAKKCSYANSSLDTLTGERILWSFSRNFFLHIETAIPSCLACCDQKFACYTRVWVSGGVVKNQSHFIQNEPQILTTGGFTHQLVSNFGINWHLWV